MYAEPKSNSEVRRLATQLYAEKRDYLLAIARGNAVNAADAEEALQEAFVSFIRAFDPKRGAPPLAWLTLTLKRECWAKRRNAHLDRHAGQEAAPGSEGPGFSLADLPAQTAGPEEMIERAEYVLEARERLGALKPAERRALGLIAAGFSYAEIGQMSGWSYTKINRCASEGRAALRKAPAG